MSMFSLEVVAFKPDTLHLFKILIQKLNILGLFFI